MEGIMGELTQDAAQDVLGTFLRSFNEQHGSAYVVTEHQPAADQSCDYLCEDAGRPREPLKVQLTRAPMTVDVKMPDGSKETMPMHQWLSRRDLRYRGLGRWGTMASLVGEAVERKATLGDSARDLVLVVFFDLKRYDEDIDLPEMRSAARWELRKAEAKYGTTFREVWAVWDFEDARGEADCLWPVPEARMVAASGPPRRWEESHQAIDADGLVHVSVFGTGDALCGAYLIGDFLDEPKRARCPECDILLHEGAHPRSRK
jgi:hypothetical protein